MSIALPRTAARLIGPALSGLLLATLSAPAQTAPTALDRQLARIDFSVNGVGEFTRNTSGPVTRTDAPNAGTVLSLSPSNTLGAIVTLRYTARPYLGAELNYGYARYSENYSYITGAVQSNVSEYTLGYVAHIPHPFFGVSPFVSAGGGGLSFHPTSGGGQNLHDSQPRGAFYYAAGVEAPVLNPHFGLRAQVRQIFFVAPDFNANYLYNHQRTSTFEPGIGFYLHF